MNDHYSVIKNNILTKINDNEYLLHNPNDGLINSTSILESNDRIIIMGDFCPDHNGVISNIGYSLKWFGKKELYKSDHYLCSKFLVKDFFRDDIYNNLENYLEDNDIKDFVIEEEIYDITTLLNAVSEIVSQDYHSKFINYFYTYNIRDKNILCAIQKRFSEEYA